MRGRSLLWRIYPGFLIITVLALIAIDVYAANSLKGIFVEIILEGMLIAALVAAMTLVTSRRIVKPLEEIRTGADKFRQGDFSYRLKVTGSDEVKELAKTMNQMAQDLKERLAKLKRIEDIQREFVANVSHELKTPIASIQGFAETLRDGADRDPEKSKPFLEIIAAHSRRISTIIEDLLSLSRIDDEKKIELEQRNLKEVLNSAISLASAMAAEKNIGIELNCDGEISASINATLFEQALLNLIDNAIKHSEIFGRVVVECRPSGEKIEISVKDFGCGIPPEHIGRIFERFYRVDKVKSRKQGGTGLGLSIAKHIVELHHGTIRVESKSGAGSTFTVRLPRA